MVPTLKRLQKKKKEKKEGRREGECKEGEWGVMVNEQNANN